MEVSKRVELFIKKFHCKPDAFEVCPKFEYCSVNKCLLHKDFIKLKSPPEDKQRKCKCPKSIRKEIGTYFRLKNLGLSVRELEGVRLSIRIKQQSLFTKDKKLKTSEDSTEIPNTSIKSYPTKQGESPVTSKENLKEDLK